MSGHRGGLQTLLSVKCGRVVFYINCFCHKLHLVITDIITDIPAIGDHYSLVKCLYDCLKLADVKQRYTGVQLKRLLDTRWSGHRDCAHAINSEFMEIIRCLDACCSSRDAKSEHRIIAWGLLTQISIPSSLLMNKFLIEFLDVINIARQVCQSKSSNLADALNVIDEISSHTNIYSVKKIEHDLDGLDEQYGLKTRPVSENTQSSWLENFVVDVPIPSVSKNENEVQELRGLVVELSDHFHAEMENRFAIANTSLWSSSHPKFCNAIFLNPFFEYMLTIPMIERKFNELQVGSFASFKP